MDWLNADSIARGFDTAAGTFAWGTTFEQLEALGLRSADAELGLGAWRVPGVDVLGLRSSRMQLMAPYPGRPVMQVWHRLDLPESESHVDFVLRAHAQLVAQLSMPDYGEMQPARFKEENAWNVVVNAGWRVGGVNVSVSWYGAPRNDEAEGKTSGILCLDWDDEIAAATPWVDAWQQEQVTLDAMLRQAHTVARLQAGPAHEQALNRGQPRGHPRADHGTARAAQAVAALHRARLRAAEGQWRGQPPTGAVVRGLRRCLGRIGHPQHRVLPPRRNTPGAMGAGAAG